MYKTRVLLLFSVLGMALLTIIFTVDLLQAQPFASAITSQEPASAALNNTSDIVVVADTTATMQPELDALATAWDSDSMAGGDRLFHLVGYKDNPQYLGSTANANQFQNWLDELTASGGGECEDAMLQALAQVARNLPDSQALVLSDAAPMGKRARLAFVVNKLVQKGIRVNTIISDWCDDSQLTESSMFALARLTGGYPFIVEESDVETASKAALGIMNLEDSLTIDNDTVDGVQIYPLVIDSSVTTLGVDDNKCRIWCLTCTLTLQDNLPPSASPEELQLKIRDPEGNILQPGDPGVTVLQTDSGTAYRIDVAQVYTPVDPTDNTWEIIVEGNDDHILSASAQSGLHFEVVGKRVLRADRTNLLRTRLITDPGTTVIDTDTVKFGVMSTSGSNLMQINLFDDGQHGDGEAGDGVYGGPVNPKKGIWYVVAWGKLTDGSAFRRVDSTPVRVKGFNMEPASDSEQPPGTATTAVFNITNDSDAEQSYELDVASSQEWAEVDAVPNMITLAAGESKAVEVPVNVPANAQSGEVEETSLTAVELNDFSASETVSVNTAVVTSPPLYLPAILKP